MFTSTFLKCYQRPSGNDQESFPKIHASRKTFASPFARKLNKQPRRAAFRIHHDSQRGVKTKQRTSKLVPT